MLRWLVIANRLSLARLQGCCERELIPYIDFLCKAEEARELPVACVIRIVEGMLAALRRLFCNQKGCVFWSEISRALPGLLAYE